ncbi:hypothetical protein [Paenibacillus sp. KN14-4R]|uniref:hypothetical protein n=1 Tax=Paenibacillus sp. KN14-4R TaxID=3445773 RepID=UPI003F9FC637
MSFCCGASMIGAKGTLKHLRTHIHNVPIVFCPVCHRVEVHYMVEHEYEVLSEYAHSDGAYEVDFVEYVDPEEEEIMFENCISHEDEDPVLVVQNQIDMALDLLSVAKKINDEEWETQLKKRLAALSVRRGRLLKKDPTVTKSTSTRTIN